MNLSEPFIRRPVATTLLALALVVFGALGYFRLPVSNLPNVDFPTIQVSASLQGADPETMAASVATPLERQFTTIAGLESMSSTSIQGSTRVTLQFKLDRDIDSAAQDVQSAISAASRQLPPAMDQEPSFRKVNPADQAVLLLAINSETMPLSKVDEYAETMLAQRISTVSGVSQVNVYGAQKYAVRAQIDPRELASRGLSVSEVETALRQGNVNVPTGTLRGPFRSYDVQAQGQLKDASAYRDLVVSYRNGAPVRLGDLGRVLDSVENDQQAAWFNGKRGMVLAIQRQPGSNTIAVVDGVLATLPELRRALPASVSLDLLYDRSATIRESVFDVQFTLGLTIALVVMVIFLFLRSFTATLIPSLALPCSIVATFGLMAMFGFSLDNLSLMALTLATGFVVDDAIVMLENIVRHVEAGENRLTAALKGAREVGFTIVAMTISLVAVFIPVLFMGGVVGRLFNEFAVTLTIAILVSMVVSLTLTPMLGARFLKAEHPKGRFYDALERGFDAVQGLYDRTLGAVMRHRRAALAGFVAIAALSAWLFTLVPKGFLPTEDVGQIMISLQAQQGTSFDEMLKHQVVATEIVAEDPDVSGFMSTVSSGGSGPMATGGTSGRMFLTLKPRHERRASAEDVVNRLRRPLSGIPGIRAFLTIPPSIRIGGMSTRSSYHVTLQGIDPAALEKGAAALEARLNTMPGLTGVNSDQEARSPQVQVRLDREAASAAGVSADAILQTLATAFGTRQVSRIYTASNDYQVILEVLPELERT